MRASLDFSAKSVHLYITSEEFVLLLELEARATDKKLITGEGIGTPSEYFTSDSKTATKSMGSSEE